MSIKEEVFRSNDYSIYRHKPEDCLPGIVVVCFDEILGGLNRQGFGTSFLFKNKIESFFVSHAYLSFYQELSQGELLDKLGGYLVGKDVYTYGSSLGGYAALYYAKILNATAIAFSPRCSIDPVYKSSGKYSVEFKHEYLDCIKTSDVKKPLVVIDPCVPADIRYFESRVLSSYGEDLYLIKLPQATHHVAKALLSMGVLKELVLSFILKKVVVNIDFDPLDNVISLSAMALSNAKTGNYKLANNYLKKINELGIQPSEDKRLQAYLILIENEVLDHAFNRKVIFKSELRSVYNKLFRSHAKVADVRSALLLQIKFYIGSLEFDHALGVFNTMSRLYPVSSEDKVLLSRIKSLIVNSERRIF